MTLKDLGMTEAQAVEEILTLRQFNNFLEDRFGDEYMSLVAEFSRFLAEKEHAERLC